MQNRHSPFRSAVPLWNPDGNGFFKRGLQDLLCGTEGQIVYDEGFIGLPERCGDKAADWIRKVHRLDFIVSRRWIFTATEFKAV